MPLSMDVTEPISAKLTLVQWHNWVVSGTAGPGATVHGEV